MSVTGHLAAGKHLYKGTHLSGCKNCVYDVFGVDASAFYYSEYFERAWDTGIIVWGPAPALVFSPLIVTPAGNSWWTRIYNCLPENFNLKKNLFGYPGGSGWNYHRYSSGSFTNVIGPIPGEGWTDPQYTTNAAYTVVNYAKISIAGDGYAVIDFDYPGNTGPVNRGWIDIEFMKVVGAVTGGSTPVPALNGIWVSEKIGANKYRFATPLAAMGDCYAIIYPVMSLACTHNISVNGTACNACMKAGTGRWISINDSFSGGVLAEQPVPGGCFNGNNGWYAITSGSASLFTDNTCSTPYVDDSGTWTNMPIGVLLSGTAHSSRQVNLYYIAPSGTPYSMETIELDGVHKNDHWSFEGTYSRLAGSYTCADATTAGAWFSSLSANVSSNNDILP